MHSLSRLSLALVRLMLNNMTMPSCLDYFLNSGACEMGARKRERERADLRYFTSLMSTQLNQLMFSGGSKRHTQLFGLPGHLHSDSGLVVVMCENTLLDQFILTPLFSVHSHESEGQIPYFVTKYEGLILHV